MTYVNEDQCDRLKIKDIIQKLKDLECPLICNEEDAWAEEILFKPNVDKYRLLEWVFSKFELSISKKLNFSMSKGSEFQSTSEVIVKNLLDVISSLGICNRDRSDIIQGTAPFKDQLNFWKQIVDILWKKCSSYNSSEAGTSSCSKGSWGTIEQQHKAHAEYISKLCENVNFGHLFKEEVDVFPTLLLQESKENTYKESELKELGIKSLKELKAVAAKNFSNGDFKELFKSKVLEDKEVNANCSESIIENENGLDKLEDVISSSLSELQVHAKVGFNDAYENLKYYLDVSLDESTDVGPSLNAANVDLSGLLELKNALSTLKSSESELKTLKAAVQNFEVPNQPLSDAMLREYIAVLNDK